MSDPRPRADTLIVLRRPCRKETVGDGKQRGMGAYPLRPDLESLERSLERKTSTATNRPDGPDLVEGWSNPSLSIKAPYDVQQQVEYRGVGWVAGLTEVCLTVKLEN